MPYLPKIVLHCRTGVPKGIDTQMEAFIADGVKYVGVVGQDAELTEDIIDECVVGDGSDHTRYILTASHKVESVEYALQFAQSLTGESEGAVQLVEL